MVVARSGGKRELDLWVLGHPGPLRQDSQGCYTKKLSQKKKKPNRTNKRIRKEGRKGNKYLPVKDKLQNIYQVFSCQTR